MASPQEVPGARHGPLSRLEQLADELISAIVGYLPTAALKNASLVSTTLHRHATDRLWETVCLVDCWKLHPEAPRPWPDIYGGRGAAPSDEHDDSPIIEKLFILAMNPVIASKVKSLTHRCHLPPPNIASELPRMHFDSETLSQDKRLHILLKLAIRNLVNVHTLRVVYGHMHLASILVADFLHHGRPQHVPLRKLWLENCSLSVNAMRRLSPDHLTGLESLRIRRVNAASLLSTPKEMGWLEFRLTRSGMYYPMRDGSGNWKPTTVQYSLVDTPEPYERFSDEYLLGEAQKYDAQIWAKFPEIEELVAAHQDLCINDTSPSLPLAVTSFQWVTQYSAPTLTSINLDWVMWRHKGDGNNDDSAAMLNLLATLKFPRLQALQIRNAVDCQTKLPDNIFLLEDTFLDFMEYHQNLKCLAWPMDKFYSHIKPSAEVQNRSRRVIAHLANTLTDLLVDAYRDSQEEPITENSDNMDKIPKCLRRRRFIAEFTPSMRRIESIKIEGSIPRDEKREILRALYKCPLKNIVMFSVLYPLGNTWGARGQNLMALDQGLNPDDMRSLEEEEQLGICASNKPGSHMPDVFEYEPSYGPAQAALLQTIAHHHAATVEKLKICGYHGCPILSQATPITDPLLCGLRHFDNLRELVMTFLLLTRYDGSPRDIEIISSWKDSPSSTTLVVVPPPSSPTSNPPVDPPHFPGFEARFAPPEEFDRWADALRNIFSPSALAYRVARDIGPYLSSTAKSRPGGVRVRASFRLGVNDFSCSARDVFELDIKIGKNNEVLQFIGPREQVENGRFWQKLESRGWF